MLFTFTLKFKPFRFLTGSILSIYFIHGNSKKLSLSFELKYPDSKLIQVSEPES